LGDILVIMRLCFLWKILFPFSSPWLCLGNINAERTIIGTNLHINFANWYFD